MNKLYPIFLKMDQLQLLIVGAGTVGLEKLSFLLKSSPNANVRLVSEDIDAEVAALIVNNPRVDFKQKSYDKTDIEGIDIVIAATNVRATNQIIRRDAKAIGKLVNVADTPDLCDFYLGAIVTKGDLKLAISTNGKSPTFAKRFRQMLEASLPNSIPDILKNLRHIRDGLKGDFGNKVAQLNTLTEVLVKK